MPLGLYSADMPVALVRSYRVFFAALTIVAVGGQLAFMVRTGSHSLVNYFSYFTTQSNLLSAAVFLVAARPSRAIDGWRGLAVTCMIIVGAVFNLLLRSAELAPLPWVNAVVHGIMPIVMVADWIVVPAVRIAWPAALAWLGYPLAWLAYTLVRGAWRGWYPYPFLNVPKIGTEAVATACVAIAAGFVVTALLVAQLTRLRPATPA